jgi:uncharacterized protein (TIGR03437 family)
MRICLFVHALLTTALFAQPDRISTSLENAQRVTLRGNLHPRAISRNDLGPVEPGFALEGLTLHLAPTSAQQADLQTLLAQQQDPGSPHFHKWLTPEEYADRFGASPADVSKISAWLESRGFAVDHTARARNQIVFAGTADQVAAAFQTSIHRFRDDSRNTTRYANTSEPSVPAALSNLVTVIRGLDDFAPSPAAHPEYNALNGSHELAPDDLATIYDINPLYKSGIDGTGQKIVVIGQSRANLTDLQTFRTVFGLPLQIPKLILVPGYPDPGFSASSVEAALDLQWAGAIARNASVTYVYSTSALTAITYAVDQNLAPVMSVSFLLGCEQDNSPALLLLVQSIAQQANAQGITWVNGSGDSGAAGCDPQDSPVAQNGAAVPFPGGIPEVTSVGGSQLDDSGGAYWNASNGAAGGSAISYIPERAWNDTAAAHVLSGGGGGSSTFFFKPPWQTGPGVPSDLYRDAPDVALLAGSKTPYLIYYGGSQIGVWGTSAATPVFAGMLALVNQVVAANTGQTGLGNINPMLYRIAQSAPGAFHDITAGDNFVPCAASTPNCSQNFFGYSAGLGYDRVTGLGSPDLNVLVQQWSTQAPASGAGKAVVVVSASKNPVYQQAPDALGYTWQITFTLREEAGVGATVTSFTIDGVQHLSYFSQTSLAPFGSTSVGIGFTRINSSGTVTFAFSGVDAGGAAWTQGETASFVGPPPVPSVTGIANAASFQNSFAPGMQMAVFGSQLTDTAAQSAAAVPLLSYMDHFYAAVNGVLAPLYYVSAAQVNVQIPYETQPGPATLTVISADGFKIATYNFTVSPAAPGIFADGNGFTVPSRTGARGQTLILFITGEGQVSPALATGTSPDPSTPVSALPKPRLLPRMTIGGVDTPIQFIGIPSGLVGVTQVNFQIPATAPLGDQPVIVTIGNVDSMPAKITVTP